MRYGITGNTQKDKLWQPVADLVAWLLEEGIPFCLHTPVAEGLAARGLVDEALCAERTEADLASAADVVLSFGGDGTLLNTAHEVGEAETPILGVNIGRLGFLADIEVGDVVEALRCLERGDYRVERRLVLGATASDGVRLATSWALNEFVIERSGAAKLIAVEVSVDDVPLNTYWADGLIIATPTGSTAYSLSTGGPIMMPGVDAVIITPIAPHTLTVRPIVLPAHSTIRATVRLGQPPYAIAADGMSQLVRHDDLTLTIRPADHAVCLVKLPGRHYFETIRNKLMWGARS